MMLLGNLEYLLNLGNLSQVRVVDLVSVQLFHFFLRNKTALVAESLSGQILSATVSYSLLVDPVLLLEPIPPDLVVSYFVYIRID